MPNFFLLILSHNLASDGVGCFLMVSANSFKRSYSFGFVEPMTLAPVQFHWPSHYKSPLGDLGAWGLGAWYLGAWDLVA